jgi:hypothetical protein
MIVVELFNSPNQRRVRLLAHDDLAERFPDCEVGY